MKTLAILAAVLLSTLVISGCEEETPTEKINSSLENLSKETEKGVKELEKNLNDLTK